MQGFVMATQDEMPRPLISKLGGLVFIILGFLLATAGYRYGHVAYIAGGVVLLAIGVFLVVRKIIQRNQGNHR